MPSHNTGSFASISIHEQEVQLVLRQGSGLMAVLLAAVMTAGTLASAQKAAACTETLHLTSPFARQATHLNKL
jgi:hypothetical protein